MADQVYLPTADGGNTVSDALIQAYSVVNIGRSLARLGRLDPKGGARFHFSLPGSVQGFRPDSSVESDGTLELQNLPLEGDPSRRALAIRYRGVAQGRVARAGTETFIPLQYSKSQEVLRTYHFIASPTVYPGQTIRAQVVSARSNAAAVQVCLYLRHYGPEDELILAHGDSATLRPGESLELAWTLPDLGGQPIAEVGVEIQSQERAEGVVFLDSLSWEGDPTVSLGRPSEGGNLWRQAWVNAMDHWEPRYPEAYQLAQNHGMGLISQGTREWKNYSVEATINVHLALSAGLAARVQGLKRYYGLMVCADQKIRLVKALDGNQTLAEKELAFAWDDAIRLKLEVTGNRIQGWVNGSRMFDHTDESMPLLGGGVALLVEEGRTSCEEVTVRAV